MAGEAALWSSKALDLGELPAAALDLGELPAAALDLGAIGEAEIASKVAGHNSQQTRPGEANPFPAPRV